MDIAAVEAALALPNAVSSAAIASLPAAAGVYAIWSVPVGDSHLLYVGRSENVRTRIREYLAPKRPNETLCLHLIDQVIRPDMTADPRGVIAIAVDCLRACRFAAWQSDGRDSLSAVETAVLNRGVHGEMPLLNRPALRRRLVQSRRAVAGA